MEQSFLFVAFLTTTLRIFDAVSEGRSTPSLLMKFTGGLRFSEGESRHVEP
jgi:hypothetical protein